MIYLFARKCEKVIQSTVDAIVIVVVVVVVANHHHSAICDVGENSVPNSFTARSLGVRRVFAISCKDSVLTFITTP